MFIYWCIWGIIILMNLTRSKYHTLLLQFMMLVLLFVIGFRYEVGGDWGNYLLMLSFFEGRSLSESFLITDYAYALLNWFSLQVDQGIVLVNFFCACIVVFGYYKLSVAFKYKWITLLSLFSYTLVAVAMGYTRQSVAISLVCCAFASLLRSPSRITFFLWIISAMLFHKTAVVMLSFLFLINRPNLNTFLFYLYAFCVFLGVASVFYILSLADNVYTTGEVESSGAVRRMFVHIIPITIYYIFYSHFRDILKEQKRVFDLLALFVLGAFFLSFYFSTIADRFNLYFVVFDVVIFAKFVEILNLKNRMLVIYTLIIMHSFIFYIWSNYSYWALCCIKYKNYFFI